MLHRLEHGLFAKLNAERKLKLCQNLLRISAENETSVSRVIISNVVRYLHSLQGLVCKKALGNVLTDVSLMNRLLVLLQPQADPDSATQPAAKRARVEKYVVLQSVAYIA